MACGGSRLKVIPGTRPCTCVARGYVVEAASGGHHALRRFPVPVVWGSCQVAESLVASPTMWGLLTSWRIDAEALAHKGCFRERKVLGG